MYLDRQTSTTHSSNAIVVSSHAHRVVFPGLPAHGALLAPVASFHADETEETDIVSDGNDGEQQSDGRVDETLIL